MLRKCPHCGIYHSNRERDDEVCWKESCRLMVDAGLDGEDLALVEPVTQDDALFDHEQPDEIREAFEEFHRKNPHVYAGLRRLALGMLAKGVDAYSIKGLYETLRFDHTMRTTGQDEVPKLKLSNNHTALYARLLMAREPRLKGFFRLKTRKVDR